MSLDLFLPATELARRIRDRELRSWDLVSASLEQVAKVDPAVNAIPTLTAETALAEAREVDRRLDAGETLGPLAGLPVAHKDLTQTKGVRTTLGSKVFADWIPDVDALIVERQKAAGAITLGKTNTPEFGAGAQTFNEVFGETLNPWDTTKTCGGSSGGAAVALACGMVALADGSDMGGSLRHPANYCNVVGLRPSPGRVPMWPEALGWATFGVQGPMGRTVEDVALLLSVIAGPDRRSPIALPEPGDGFRRGLGRDFEGVRVAWSPDLGGLPLDHRLRPVLEAGAERIAGLGCIIDEATPDFKDCDEVFKTLRALNFAAKLSAIYRDRQAELKDTVIWNIEQGLALKGEDIARAELLRTEIYHRQLAFFDDWDFLIAPVSQVPPFPIEQRWIEEIEGVKMETYIDWMQSCYFITVLENPAASVPCGFTTDGLPVGLQIVGRRGADFEVLQLAKAFEDATGIAGRVPPVVAAKTSV